VEADWEGGLMMGYSLGQNGAPWPNPLLDPLGNNNRGGFHISQARAKASLAFDSSFSLVAVGNLIFADLQEVYLRKEWGRWIFQAGKFRGAGLKSGSGWDELEVPTVQRPRYARHWAHYERTIGYRDFGIQAERFQLGGDLRHRFFIRNANQENVFNDEPSFTAGAVTQVLGADYAMEWRVSPYSVLGGHVGALANREWDEFIGNHDFWEAQYWLKSNALLAASGFHQMDFPRFHLFSEALLMSNRLLLHPEDGRPTVTWGASTLARFSPWVRWSPYLGYEFTDHTDGYYPDDALHVVKAGTWFLPSPARYPAMRLAGEFARAYEDGVVNSVHNDILYVQYRMTF
jgi:hypothetical protein